MPEGEVGLPAYRFGPEIHSVAVNPLNKFETPEFVIPVVAVIAHWVNVAACTTALPIISSKADTNSLGSRFWGFMGEGRDWKSANK